MPLEIPNLDDRRFQDLVDEARRLIPHYSPRWTDHNLSDPGITLIELFATLVDTMIYRLNRVPEKSYITFMDLMGVRLEPPSAARAPITFWLSGELFGPTAEAKPVPAGTEVAIEQSAETQEPISFTTDADLEVRPPRPLMFLTSPAGGRQFESHRDVLLKSDAQAGATEPDLVPVFSQQPRASEPNADGDSFYVGFESDLSGHIVRLTYNGQTEGAGINPNSPPLRWEAWCGDQLGWLPAEREGVDGTGGLNRAGDITLHLPMGMARRGYQDIGKRAFAGFWLRCQYIRPQRGQPGYNASPQIRTLRVAALGATTTATHSTPIVGEVLGRGTGQPGQHFRLEYAPVLPRIEGETIEVQNSDGSWTAWAERVDFGQSEDKDRHFTLDDVTGEVSFGPLIREPNGRERQYGAVPPEGALLRFTRYRHGGGAKGNVGTRTLTVLKSTLPYVDRVENRRPANGGLDAETLERAMWRAPQVLRTSSRAVTAEDFEYLAKAAGQGIRRAKCLAPGDLKAGDAEPGTVRLLLIPAKEPADGPITAGDLALSEGARRAIERYLGERKLLTTTVRIEPPTYVEVTVEAGLKAREEANPDTVLREAQMRLYRFLNPLVGGPDGQGWPFGRALRKAEIYRELMNTPGVDYVDPVNIVVTGRGAQELVELPKDGLIVSGQHQIVVV